MKTIKAFFLLSLILHCSFFVSAQSSLELKPQRKLEEINGRENLSINYLQVSRFKLATRKDTYRINEIIDLVAAILNTSNQDVFFGELHPQLYLYDEKGQELKIISPAIVDYRISEDSFTRLAANEVEMKSLNLLAGCDDNAEERISDILQKGEKQMFESGTFAIYLGPCLQINRPGIYTIKARQANHYVINSPSETGIKTATGIIESEPLKIKIIN